MSNQNGKVRVCSLFSGIGGFELGIINAIGERADFVAYSEIDKYSIQTYEKNFGHYEDSSNRLNTEERSNNGGTIASTDIGNGGGRGSHPDDISNRKKGHKNYGDITTINPAELPDFDLVVGGFPCQSFSIAGKRLGFEDTRGTLFFDVARILKHKQPRHLVLENVKGLLSHDGGKTFQTILGVLTNLGYIVEWQVLNSKSFGVPQNRERVYIVGHLGADSGRKIFPLGRANSTDSTERVVSTAIDGNYFSRVRRLTPTECERLQGFPDNWTVGSDTQRYKQCGNAVTVNVVRAVMSALLAEGCL